MVDNWPNKGQYRTFLRRYWQNITDRYLSIFSISSQKCQNVRGPKSKQPWKLVSLTEKKKVYQKFNQEKLLFGKNFIRVKDVKSHLENFSPPQFSLFSHTAVYSLVIYHPVISHLVIFHHVFFNQDIFPKQDIFHPVISQQDISDPAISQQDSSHPDSFHSDIYHSDNSHPDISHPDGWKVFSSRGRIASARLESCTLRSAFLFGVQLNGIWLRLQFYFSAQNRSEIRLVTHNKKRRKISITIRLIFNRTRNKLIYRLG